MPICVWQTKSQCAEYIPAKETVWDEEEKSVNVGGREGGG